MTFPVFDESAEDEYHSAHSKMKRVVSGEGGDSHESDDRRVRGVRLGCEEESRKCKLCRISFPMRRQTEGER